MTNTRAETNRKIWMVCLVFLALFVIAVLAPTNKPGPSGPSPQLTAADACEMAGKAVAKPGFTLIHSTCQPDGTMCFKTAEFINGLIRHEDFIVIFPNGATREGDPNDKYTIDDRGRVIERSIEHYWDEASIFNGIKLSAEPCAVSKSHPVGELTR